jgi:hypothetical protein
MEFEDIAAGLGHRTPTGVGVEAHEEKAAMMKQPEGLISARSTSKGLYHYKQLMRGCREFSCLQSTRAQSFPVRMQANLP